MSSNKWWRISLKLRLTIIYTLLFLISCALIFSMASYWLYREINQMIDNEFAALAREAQEIAGIDRKNHQDSIALQILRDSYPDAEKNILAERFPGMELVSVRQESAFEPGGRRQQGYHTAFIFYKDKYYECRVRSDGSVYSKAVRDSEHLNAVRQKLNRRFHPHEQLSRRFRELARLHGQENILIILRDHSSGRLIINAGSSLKKHRKIADSSLVLDKSFESNGFRYAGFRLADYGELIIGRSIRYRDQLIRRSMVIFTVILLSISGAGVAVAWLVARRFIKGIKQTTLAMQSIAGGDYSYRISTVPYNDEEILTLMETFNDMNERTENLLREIKMMSDNVAHDLRTPLTRISGTVELLLATRELDEEIRNVCVSVLEETLRLKALVNTIMDISRTNAHPDSLKKELLDINALIRNFSDFMLPAFEEKELYLKLNIPENPCLISADRTMLQRMLANLVENALKFTNSGGVTISVIPDKRSLTVCVRDSGCGIKSQDMPHIFDRFYRADTSRHLAGNGLGLALVKAVASAHKWELEADSTPGCGTTFTIMIPLNDCQEKK